MKLLRAFTWYFRFAHRQCLRFVELFKRPSSHDYALANCVFLVILPGIIGAALFAVLHVTGLSRLIWGNVLPTFFFTEAASYLAHGAITFALGTIVIAVFYFLLGCLCSIPDAFRSPNYKTSATSGKTGPTIDASGPARAASRTGVYEATGLPLHLAKKT